MCGSMVCVGSRSSPMRPSTGSEMEYSTPRGGAAARVHTHKSFNGHQYARLAVSSQGDRPDSSPKCAHVYLRDVQDNICLPAEWYRLWESVAFLRR